MKVADLLFALSELRAGRITVDQLIAACSAWSNEPNRPLADFLKPGAGQPPAVPLAEPASGVLSSFADRRPTAPRRRPPADRGGVNRTLVFVAAGIGVVALVGMALGLGYLGQTNARLEADVAKLKAANADLEQMNDELAAARGPVGTSRPPEPKPSAKTDPGRDPKPPVKGDPGRDPIGPKPSPPSAKDLTALQDAHARLLKLAGPDDPRTVRAAAELGLAHVVVGRAAAGIQELEDANRRAAEHRLPGAPSVAITLAHAWWATGQADRAIELCDRVRDELDDKDPLAPEARLQLALAYRAAGQWDRAKPLFLDHLVSARKANNDRQTADALAWLGECLLKLGKAADAEPLIREYVDLSTRQAADWSAFNAKSLLGAVELAQKKPEQAESLLTVGYDGLKARRDTIPWDRRDALPDAAGRLAKLYETTGDAAKAAEWKKVEEQERGKK